MLHLLVVLPSLLSGGCLAEAVAAERLYDSGDDSGAVRLLEQARATEPDCPETAWRLAYVRLAEANREPDKTLRAKLWTLGRNLSNRCVEAFPRSGGAWFASALEAGVETTFAGARRRVELSKIVHERVARSIELDPDLAGSWYLLAKWHEGLCSLNIVERGFANLLLGGLPEGASLDSTREYLKRSNALRPNSPLILLDLANNLERSGRTSEALAICHHASSLPRLAVGDRINLDKIDRLRRKLERTGT
jgi:hypothetical protein